MLGWRVGHRLHRFVLVGIFTTILGTFPTIGIGQILFPSVSAQHGIAIGRDLNMDGGSITIGLTPEQVRDYMLAVLREESSAQAKVDELSSQLHVTSDAVVEFFHILGQKEVPLEKLPETLAQLATQHREMLDRLAALNPEDPAVKEQIEEARTAV